MDLVEQIYNNPDGKPLGNSSKITTVQIAGVLKQLLIDSKAKDAKILSLEKEVKDLKAMGNRVDKLEKKFNEQAEDAHLRTFFLERKAVAPNLIIKNIPKAENETKEQLSDQVRDVFATMQIPEDEYDIADVFRIKKNERKPSKAGQAKDYPPLIKVRLRDASMKGAIFRKVTTLKGSAFEKISIENEVPASVRREYGEKQKEAYEIRKESGFKTKTRIETFTGHAIIKIKTEKDEKFRSP